MGITGYTAMTAAEFYAAPSLPAHSAWMACHFSCYATGLTNLPKELPKGSMIIVNDRTPVQGHDPELIAEQLRAIWQTTKNDCFLLDLQRSDNPETRKIVETLVTSLPCPVGVSELYADGLDCPVFLPPPPIDRPLKRYLQKWEGREIWLEIAEDAQTATITPEGCHIMQAVPEALCEPTFYDSEVHCSYHIELTDDAAVFHLLRNKSALGKLLSSAKEQGVTAAVGLYQQLDIDFFTE